MDQDTLVIWCDSFLEMIFRLQAKAIEIYKIWNNFDILRNLKMTIGIFLKILRNRGYAIALINRESYHRLISSIFAHQSNIGTVQSGYKRNINTISSQNLFRHKRSRCMWDSVVNV
ncbi:hypothetical protein D3C85_1455380 [compost metagenome]